MPQTKQLYEPTAWNLGALFSAIDAPEIETALDELESQTAEVESCRQQLSPAISEEDFCRILQKIEAVNRTISRVAGMGHLSFAADTQDQAAQNFMAKMGQISAETANRALFFSLWWKELDDENAARLLENAGIYRYYLESLRLQIPYTLSEAEEKIINLKDVNGIKALSVLYQSITNRYSFSLNEGDDELTRSELSAFFSNPDPKKRSAAYQELYRVYAQDEAILGQIYQYIVRDWHSENVTLRGFAAPISLRNLGNHISDEIVDRLLDVYAQNRDVFHRYFQLKADKLETDKLNRTDLYAPLQDEERQIDYHDGVQLTLETFDEFDPEIGQLARRVFAENHIDSELRPGKRMGAFCASITPEMTPFILMSYQGKGRDVATLAHELGHAIHSMLSDKHSQFTFISSLPMAETASTFSEILLTEKLLAHNSDPKMAEAILFRQLDDAYATVGRQAGFALFEKAAHDQVLAGAGATELSDLYFSMLSDEFGGGVFLPEDFRYEWLAIPHIYLVPFYVYAYSFGQLLVLSLYQQYQQEGASFVPRFKQILAAGGSNSPEQILTNAGIDIGDANFWQGGFDVLSNMIDRVEQLG